MTQQQLADRSGIGRPTIARLENKGEARISTVAKLASALGATPTDLMSAPPER